MRGYSSFNVIDENLPDQVVWNTRADVQEHKKSQHKIDLTEVFKAHQYFSQTDIVEETTLLHCPNLSTEYEANIFLKREDHQRGSARSTQVARTKYAEPITSICSLMRNVAEKDTSLSLMATLQPVTR